MSLHGKLSGTFWEEKNYSNAIFVVFDFLCVQFKRAAGSVCEVARSIGCGGLGKKVFDDRNEEKK